MNQIKLNHWYVNENELSILLMNFHVSLNRCKDIDSEFLRLTVTNSKMKSKLFAFDNLEQAISFTEDVISNCHTLNEILNQYTKYYWHDESKKLLKK